MSVLTEPEDVDRKSVRLFHTAGRVSPQLSMNLTHKTGRNQNNGVNTSLLLPKLVTDTEWTQTCRLDTLILIVTYYSNTAMLGSVCLSPGR